MRAWDLEDCEGAINSIRQMLDSQACQIEELEHRIHELEEDTHELKEELEIK